MQTNLSIHSADRFFISTDYKFMAACVSTLAPQDHWTIITSVVINIIRRRQIEGIHVHYVVLSANNYYRSPTIEQCYAF